MAISLKARKGNPVRDVALAMMPLDRERALTAAFCTLEWSHLHDQTYADIVPLIAVDDPARAERLAQDISHIGQRAVALASVAMALVPCDLAASEAVLVTARRTALVWDTSAVHGVAAVVAPHDLALASAILREDRGDEAPSPGLRRVAEALIPTDPDRAEEVALSIPDPGERFPVLLRLLEP